MNMKKSFSSTKGSVLIIMGAVMFAVIYLIGFGLLATRQAWRENSSKLLAQTLANQNMLSVSNDLRTQIKSQFAASAAINLVNSPKVNSGASLGHERIPIFGYTASSGLTSLTATQGDSGLVSLQDANDPLYGIRSKTTVFHYRQSASLIADPALGSRGARDQAADVEVEIRQFPLSQFSQFYAADNILNGANLAALGRTHANGNLTLDTACTALYPLTVAGRLNFGPGASVAVKQFPGASNSYGVGSSTTMDVKRALMQNSVVDQDVVQSSITTAATLAQMVSPPSVNLGSSAKNAQKLSTRCDVVVFYNSTAKTFTAMTRGNTSDPATQTVMAPYTGDLQTRAGGHPVVEFDVSRLETAGSRWTSYYVHSDDPQAVVIIRNGETLPRALSIVTPHDIWVDAAFNTPADAAKIRPASIVTGGRIIGVDG